MSDPTQAQYGTEIEKLPPTITKPSTVSVPSKTPQHGGGLPFTGYDVGALFVVAVALTAVGMVLRRVGP